MACNLGNDVDDAFGDEFEDDRAIFENEWTRNASARVKEGYREGLAVGQDVKLQEGFNEGYRISALESAEIARIKGSLSAILAYNLLRKGTFLTEEASAEFESILGEITSLQESSTGKKSSMSRGCSTSELSTIKSMAEKLGLLDVEKRTTSRPTTEGDLSQKSKNIGQIDIEDNSSDEISVDKLITDKDLGTDLGTGGADQTDSRGTTLQGKKQSTNLREIISIKDKLNRLLTSHNLQHLF